ncbi:hypothetical protein Trydic_g18386 [Trypoxylus dichotomus]
MTSQRAVARDSLLLVKARDRLSVSSDGPSPEDDESDVVKMSRKQFLSGQNSQAAKSPRKHIFTIRPREHED